MNCPGALARGKRHPKRAALAENCSNRLAHFTEALYFHHNIWDGSILAKAERCGNAVYPGLKHRGNSYLAKAKVLVAHVPRAKAPGQFICG